MTALLAVVLMTAQTRVGDHWSADRTLRFLSSKDGIDMTSEDRVDLSVEKSTQGLAIRLSRKTTATKLSDGTVIPAPDGEPETWVEQLAPSESTPEDSLERTLARIVVAAWRGPAARSIDPAIVIKELSPTQEKITFGIKTKHGQERLEGEANLDPKTNSLVSISLLGENVQIPGGPDIVSLRVDYVLHSGSK